MTLVTGQTSKQSQRSNTVETQRLKKWLQKYSILLIRICPTEFNLPNEHGIDRINALVWKMEGLIWAV